MIPADAKIQQPRCKVVTEERGACPMAQQSFDTLKKVIVDNSVADDFYGAVPEWSVVAVEEDPASQGECVCGQQNLRYMYTIHNNLTQQPLSFIGNQCIRHFRREDLDAQATIFSQLLTLKTAIDARTTITLTTDYVSKRLLDWLFAEGAFDSERNNFNGKDDHAFLVQMFNKRKKEIDISDAQNKKIWVLLNPRLKPFIQNHPALG